MKKFICALIACAMTISFIACSSDSTSEDSSNDSTSKPKDTTAAYQTVVVTDEEGNTTVIEVTEPVEDSGDGSSSQTETNAPDTEGNDVTSSDTESESKADETTYPIEKNPIDDLDGIALIDAAYNKMNTLDSYEYTALTKMDSNGEKLEYTVKTVYKDSGEDIQYASEIIFDGNVENGIYHKDGYTYQTIDGEQFKGKMTKAEFKEYLFEVGMNTSEYVSAFKKLETKKTESGAVVTLSELDVYAIYDIPESMSSSLSIKKAEGNVVIDKSGHIISEHIAISLQIGKGTSAQSFEISADTEVKNVDSVASVTFPALNGYRETDCLAGLYRLTLASEAYDEAMLNGMTFELDQDISITGPEKAHDVVKAECTYSYTQSLLTQKILMDMHATGSYNGEAQEMTVVSDGKNVTMVYNGLENKTKYDEDLVWTLLSEMLEYTLGYASCIVDIKEEKAGDDHLYTYTADEDYGYYFLEKAVSCLETEIDHDEIASVTFKSINCTSRLDKYGELEFFSNSAVFTFKMQNGDVYNVDYNVSITVRS